MYILGNEGLIVMGQIIEQDDWLFFNWILNGLTILYEQSIESSEIRLLW